MGVVVDGEAEGLKSDLEQLNSTSDEQGSPSPSSRVERGMTPTISYMAERVVGTGSFGIVFQAKCLGTGETVAIKKVLQDRCYKNRVCHGDVKPQNVLVDPLTHQVEICDFGSAKVLVR
ncbi:hypothetical protein ZWY2020_049909 [Hordeum vulgare]|nr:hypothetical protein ZWY2020_049909 [Hordeum vulgare]